jgi:hypothetical protein
MNVDLKAFGDKLNASFQAIATSAENFTLLQDGVAKAVAARDEARLVVGKQLDDLEAAIRELREKLNSDAAPAPHVEPAPAPAPTA